MNEEDTTLGNLIDNLIEVTIDKETPVDISKQLEPIVDGLVELLQGEPKQSGAIYPPNIPLPERNAKLN